MSPPSAPRAAPPRWAALAVVLGLALAALLAIWWGTSLAPQLKVMATYPLVLFTGIALLIWLLRSRLPSRVRRAVLLGALAVGMLFLAAFRFDGFTGDLVPLFTPRWSAADLRVADLGNLRADDFPQYLGPNRNGRLEGPALARDWDADPPQELWRRPIGEGWSGFAVRDAVAVTQEQTEEGEFVTAFDLTSGETIWSTRHDEAFTSSLGGNGPRATPTLTDTLVFATSAAGTLTALDLRTGELLWSRDFVDETRASVPEWGHSGSPLIVADAVVINAGGDGAALIAYARDTGELRWSGGSDPAGYASPMLVRRDGVDQIVNFSARSVAGHSPLDGRVLWRHEWSPAQPNVAQPLPIAETDLLVSAGYGIGAQRLRIQRINAGEESLSVEPVWERNTLRAKFSNFLEIDGLVYGLDEGIMTCIDPADGQRQWKGGRYGHGQILQVGDLLLVQGERGDVFLIEPNGDELRELGSFKALPRKAWNTPALAGNLYLVRNHQEAAAFQLPTT